MENNNNDLVSIITPTWNGLPFLKQMVESVVRNTDWPYELIIIDNGSTDGTVEYLENLDVGIDGQLIKNDKNMGFAVANNQGVEKAKGKYLLFLNNDVLVTKGWLTAMVEVFSKETAVGIVGARLIHPGKETIQHVGIVRLESGLPDHVYFNKPSNYKPAMERKEYFAVTGACLLIPKGLFNEVGGFDEIYLNGWEDSVSRDMPIIVRKDNQIQIIPIEDLYSLPHDGREELRGVQILSARGWANANYCYQHKVKKKLYRVRTSSGVIVTTGDHGLFSNGVAVRTDELKVGDKIDMYDFTKLAKDVTGDRHIKVSKDRAWLDGLFCAEGTAGIYKGKHISRRKRILKDGRVREYVCRYLGTTSNARISMYDEASIRKANKILNWKIYKARGHAGKIIYMTDLVGENKRQAVEYLINRFYTKKSKQKAVPLSILRSGNKTTHAQFIDGFLKGDGHIARVGNYTRAMYTTDSMTMGLGIQILLENLGRIASVNCRNDKRAVNIRERGGNIGTNQYAKLCARPKRDDGTVLAVTDVTHLYRNQEGYVTVYDVNTDDGSFVSGLGGIIAHNCDLCNKVKQKGYRIFYEPKAKVYHYESRTEGRYAADSRNFTIYMNRWELGKNAKKISINTENN